MERDELRAGVVEDVGDLVRRQPDVDRVQHRPGFEDAVVRLQEVVRVVRDERDAIPGSDPQPNQRVGQPMRPLRVGAVRELLLAVDDADLVAEVGRGSVTELEDRERHEHREPPCSTGAVAGGKCRARGPARHAAAAQRGPADREGALSDGGPGRLSCHMTTNVVLSRHDRRRHDHGAVEVLELMARATIDVTTPDAGGFEPGARPEPAPVAGPASSSGTTRRASCRPGWRTGGPAASGGQPPRRAPPESQFGAARTGLRRWASDRASG